MQCDHFEDWKPLSASVAFVVAKEFKDSGALVKKNTSHELTPQPSIQVFHRETMHLCNGL